jgi:DNA polymerase-3 subunit chi
MNEIAQQKVYFLRVKDVSEKLNTICGVIHKHYNIKEPVLIVVPSQEAAAYIDQLLWRQPNDSFLPHCISNLQTEEKIVITTSKENLNRSKIVFNLCGEAYSNLSGFSIVYDLIDLTHPSKEQLSQTRLKTYQEMIGAANVTCS